MSFMSVPGLFYKTPHSSLDMCMLFSVETVRLLANTLRVLSFVISYGGISTDFKFTNSINIKHSQPLFLP